MGDFVTSSKFGEDGTIENATKAEGIKEGMMGLDCGPESVKLNAAAIMASKTIIWNGPMGVFEMVSFENGTKSMMDTVVEATKAGVITVIGRRHGDRMQEVRHRGQGHARVDGRRRLARAA